MQAPGHLPAKPHHPYICHLPSTPLPHRYSLDVWFVTLPVPYLYLPLSYLHPFPHPFLYRHPVLLPILTHTLRRDGYPSSPSTSRSYPSWDYYYYCYYCSLTPPSLPLLLLFRFWFLLHCPLGGQLSTNRRLAFHSTH